MADGGRSRRRPLILAAAAGVVLVLVVGVVAWVDRKGPEPEPATELVATTAGRWLRAWERGDVARMERLTTEPEAALGTTVRRFGETFGPGTITARARRPAVLRDRAVVRFDVSISQRGLGQWRYEGHVFLERVEREGRGGRRWLIEWSPSALHPALTAGTRVVRTTTWPDRAPLLAADGEPLAEEFPGFAGRLGEATASRAAELAPFYRAGQVVGISGLQARLERRLAGQPATEIRLVGKRAPVVLARFIGIRPTPVLTTFDAAVQAAAEDALDAGLLARQRADVQEAARNRPAEPSEASAPDATSGSSTTTTTSPPEPASPPLKRAAMVVVRPSTGAVLATVSRPRAGFDRALMGRYPPGSTFKVVTTLGLLGKGVTPSTTVACPKETTVGGREFHNAEGHELGDTPFRTAFAESCNTAFVRLSEKLTPAELKAVADSLGFNRPSPLPLPVSESSVPLPASAVDAAATSIGQARVSATPMQMALVAAAVAAGGVRDPRVVDDGPPPALRPFAPGAADTLRELMRLAVSEGTGTRARLPGTPVAGKTGTAEFGVATPPHVHAWFIGFRGDLAVAVILEDAGFGGQWAAPVAADFFRRMG